MVKLVNEYFVELGKALDDDDLATVKAIFEERPDLMERERSAGGTWLHKAARWHSLDAVKYFCQNGLSINSPTRTNGYTALCSAANSGRPEIVAFLLEHGAIIDTSLSVRNPLFAAIIGGSAAVVKQILTVGIDVSIKYKSPTMYDLNAAGFAIIHDQIEIAEMIVAHEANGDKAEYSILMQDAEEAANRQLLESPYEDCIQHEGIVSGN
jgi:ankyrin repeat protein